VHGIVHVTFRDHAVAQVGKDGWRQLVHDAHVERPNYRVTESYPDDELTALILALARRTDRRVNDVLEDFGRAAASELLGVYGSFVRPEWRTLDVVEHTEHVIHRAVRMRDPGAAPPGLVAERRGRDEVAVLYRSERRMCAFGQGIILALADHYGERISVSQPKCMHLGAPHCEIVARGETAAA